jgi:cobalt-zinc-cadmium efflux system outer membrane protein
MNMKMNNFLLCVGAFVASSYGLIGAKAQSAPTAQASMGSIPTTAQAITLSEVLAMAAGNNDVQAGKQQIELARANVLMADHAPAAVLNAGISQLDLQNGVGAGSWLSEKRIDKSIGLDWTWERGGKRAYRTKAAQEALDAGLSDQRQAVLQQKLNAQRAFFELFATQERLEEFSGLAVSANALASTAAKRHSAGDLSERDTARFTIEAERARNDQLLAEQERHRAATNLSLLIGQPSSPHLMGPTLVAAYQYTAIEDSQSVNPKAMLDSRADVQAARSKLQSAKAELDNALALRSNNITLGTAMDHYPGTSHRILSLRVQVPLQLSALGGYGFEGEINRANALLISAEIQLDQAKKAAQIDIEQLLQEISTTSERMKSQTERIAPLAKKIAEQAELAYSKGALTLTDLFEARRTRRTSALEAIAARTDFYKTVTTFGLKRESAMTAPM